MNLSHEDPIGSMSPKHRLVTAEVVASALDVPIPWVYRAAKCLGMPHHRLGRYVRFDLEEVVEWVRSGAADLY